MKSRAITENVWNNVDVGGVNELWHLKLNLWNIWQTRCGMPEQLPIKRCLENMDFTAMEKYLQSSATTGFLSR